MMRVHSLSYIVRSASKEIMGYAGKCKPVSKITAVAAGDASIRIVDAIESVRNGITKWEDLQRCGM